MNARIPKSIPSPNYDPFPIRVEFLVLHYTAGTLARTLEVFRNPTMQVSSHLVISEKGKIFEIVPCWDGVTYRAWHSGKSKWFDGEHRWEEFNDFSIGVELVNLNGNIFSYSDRQYRSLAQVMSNLQSRYPALKSPSRIVGHEHIAGWRGKADPGCLFEWDRFYQLCYPGGGWTVRDPVCPPGLQAALSKLAAAVPPGSATADFWHALSRVTEVSVSLMQKTYDQVE